MSGAAPVRGRWGRISSGEGTRARRDETRILVVEDSASARKLIQAILLRLGITLPELRLSGSVDEAMRLFTEWRPELVFLDLELRTTAARPAAIGRGDPAEPPARRDRTGGRLPVPEPRAPGRPLLRERSVRPADPGAAEGPPGAIRAQAHGRHPDPGGPRYRPSTERSKVLRPLGAAPPFPPAVQGGDA